MTITVRTLRWSQALQCLLRSPPPPLVALEPVMQWRNIWVVSRRLNCRHWCHTGTWLGELLGQFSQPCPWGKQPGELLGWEKAFGATDIVAEQVGTWGTRRGSPRRIAGHLNGLWTEEAGGFPGGNEEARLLKQLNGITCKDGRTSFKGRKRL